jgi:hypothetical protein
MGKGTKEFEVGPEDLIELLRSGAIQSGQNRITLVEDDPDDEDDWKELKKAVDERLAALEDIESDADDDEDDKENDDVEDEDLDDELPDDEDEENPEPEG